MSTNPETLFEAFLNNHDDKEWAEIVRSLLPAIHEVDRTATEVWFYLFPLALARAFDQAEDAGELAYRLQMLGNYRLKDQVDASHRFLYGHRYWPDVKRAVSEHAASVSGPSSLDLARQIREVASAVAKRSKVEQSLLIGITSVALMTMQQVGAQSFKAAPGRISIDARHASRSPERVMQDRARDDNQGIFGFLRGEQKIFTATFDENDDSARFKIINSQHLTTAAAADKRDYASRDPRCIPGEGPIPVQCRSAACGTCWVGVIGGAEKLSEVSSLERRRMKEFGYIETDDAKPLIRLACQSQAFGAISLVIPPWNGVFGRFLRAQRDQNSEAQQGISL